MELMREAGIFAWVAFVVFSGGLVWAVVRPDPGARAARGLAVVVLALGLLGSALGQRLVDKAVMAEPDTHKRVVLVSMGTREASANHLLASLFAVVLLGVATAVERSRAKQA